MSLPLRNTPEWENLCDGCAKCCLFPGTQVACRHLDIDRRNCTIYHLRHEVPHCNNMSDLSNAAIERNLPDSCAYKRAIRDLPPLPAGRLIATSARGLGEIKELIEKLDEVARNADTG